MNKRFMKRTFKFNVGVMLTLILTSFLVGVVIAEGVSSGADQWLVLATALAVALVGIKITWRLNK